MDERRLTHSKRVVVLDFHCTHWNERDEERFPGCSNRNAKPIRRRDKKTTL